MSTPPNITIACKDAVEKRVHELRNRDSSIKSRVGPALKGLWNPVKPCAMGADSQVFEDLAYRFPNFIEVIHYWKSVAMVSRKTHQPFESQPILLGGPPGLGKTYFAAEAAKAMGLHFEEMSMATMTAGFMISGMNLQWAEGSPGFVASSLAKSNMANPMLLFDEIDKVSDSRYSPLGAFYTLFERHSAKRFKDEALEIELDASHVVWVATANEVSHIPEPLLSRMKYFEIRKPDTSAMLNIIHNIYQIILKESTYGCLLDEQLPEDTLDILIEFEPRSAKKLLEEACMRAISVDRSMVTSKDVNLITLPKKPSIGFIGA